MNSTLREAFSVLDAAFNNPQMLQCAAARGAVVLLK
jgi:hypothetical protein